MNEKQAVKDTDNDNGRYRYNCVVDGGSFVDSIGEYETRAAATNAGIEWQSSQGYTGTEWLEDDYYVAGGYWVDDDAPFYEVIVVCNICNRDADDCQCGDNDESEWEDPRGIDQGWVSDKGLP